MKTTTQFRTLVAGALAAAVVCFIAANVKASTVAQVEAQASGSAATLDNNPTITKMLELPGSGDGYTYTRYVYLANDGTGSIDIFGSPPNAYIPTLGDKISLSGTYSPFNMIPEITTITAEAQISSGNPTPGPTVVTVPQMLALPSGQNFAIQEYYLEIDNVQFNNSPPATWPIHANQSTTVTDGSNPDLTVFFNPSTYSESNYLAGMAIPTGKVNIRGIASVFGTTAELIPFEIIPVPEPASLTLSLLALGGVALFRVRRRIV